MNRHFFANVCSRTQNNQMVEATPSSYQQINQFVNMAYNYNIQSQKNKMNT